MARETLLPQGTTEAQGQQFPTIASLRQGRAAQEVAAAYRATVEMEEQEVFQPPEEEGEVQPKQAHNPAQEEMEPPEW